MKSKFIDSFLEAAADILHSTIGMEVHPATHRADEGRFPVADVCVVLKIHGYQNGRVIYGFSMPSALGIAGKMMGCATPLVLDEISRSAIAELGNMMAAYAVSCFERLGIRIDISTPAVMDGDSMESLSLSSDAQAVPLLADTNEQIVWVAFEQPE
ncbi:MAG: hypothetical protein AMXMBFR75_19000 [Candidatus Hinthialibacteria bacterium]|jgi:chemotaxis protein CheX